MGNQADYLVVGAGAAGMAFVDSLIDNADVHVVLLDRRHGAGGHWLDAYPFVRLHQASEFYGVVSTPLGKGERQTNGPEAGMYERAAAPDIVAYYARVLESMVASGKVTFHPNSDYLGGRRWISRLTGQEFAVPDSCRVKTARRILTQQSNSSMGRGFALANGKGGLIFNHSGSVFGYKSYVSVYRDRGRGIAVMTNGDNGYALMMEIVRSVARVYGWPDDGIFRARIVEVPQAILQTYAGNYSATLDGQPVLLEIYLAGNALMIRSMLMGTGTRSDLYPISNDTFLLKDDTNIPGTLAFTKGGSGGVTGLTIALSAGGTLTATRN